MEAIKFVFGDLELTDEVINRLAALGYTPESLKKAIKAHEWEYPSDKPFCECLCEYLAEHIANEMTKKELSVYLTND